MNEPLIVTLKLDASSQSFFDTLREKYFPKHINYLKAHCTLFHKLPAGEAAIQKILASVCERPYMNLEIGGVRNIGNGVIYNIQSGELQKLHRSLQQSFEPWLINQDRKALEPHITIQNKVTAFKAKELYEKLLSSFEPFNIKATGISTWLYLNGPWQHVTDHNFKTTVV